MNAVAHRDYSVTGRGVEVWLFDDRMEVESPGGIVDAVSLDELREGRRSHASRNPRLSRVLVDLGYMREQGEGIPRMFGEMTTQFLPAPFVEVSSKTFKVTLKKTPTITATTAEWLGEIAKEGLGENQGLGADAGGLGADAGGLRLPPELVSRAAALSPKARAPLIRQLILELCAVRPLSAGQLAVLLNRRKPRHLAEEHLAPMVTEGVLERTIPQNPTYPRQAFRTVRRIGAQERE